MSEFENKPETKGNKRGNPNWRKGGASPNPGGRPATSQELKDDFRRLTSQSLEAARQMLMTSEDEGLRKDLIIAVLKKGLPDGLSIEISGPNQGPITTTNLRLEDLSDDEVETLSRIAARGQCADD